MRNLTVNKIKSLTKPGFHADGNCLYLRVAPGGSKQWVQRLVIHGKRRDLGLGGYPLRTLAEARDIAYQNRKCAREGGNPFVERRRSKVPTFGEAAFKTFQAHKSRFRNRKTSANWMQRLERHAFPILKDMPVDTISREEVLRVLLPIWQTKHETARQVRSRIRTIFEWSEAHGYIE